MIDQERFLTWTEHDRLRRRDIDLAIAYHVVFDDYAMTAIAENLIEHLPGPATYSLEEIAAWIQDVEQKGWL